MVNKSWNNFLENKLTLFLKEIEIEWKSQDFCFPNKTHTLEKWFILISEEIGEIAKEINELHLTNYNFDNLYKEIIQTITLLLRVRYSIYTIDLQNNKIII